MLGQVVVLDDIVVEELGPVRGRLALETVEGVAHRLGRIDADRVLEHERVLSAYELPSTVPDALAEHFRSGVTFTWVADPLPLREALDETPQPAFSVTLGELQPFGPRRRFSALSLFGLVPALQASATAPAPIRVPRLPVVWPAPSSRVSSDP